MDGYAPLIKHSASGTYYYHCDHLGTPILVTDEYGNPVWKGEYEPFGKVTEVMSSIEQPIRRAGQVEDFETNLSKTVTWYKENEAWWKPLREKAEIIEW